MFNLESLRTMNCDNLQAWRVFELSEDAVATDGRRWPAKSEFWFEFVIINTLNGEALVHGVTPNGETLVFATRGWHYRQLFVDTGREWRPQGPQPAERSHEFTSGEAAAWLATRPEFARAAAIAKGHRTTGHWGASRDDADVLRRAAKLLEKSQPGVARWLAELSLTFYHTWMSQATSGGEGTAMEYEVRRELAEVRAVIAGGNRR